MSSLYFNALVLEVIDRCNARCAMCYQAAGPKGSDLRGDHSLATEDVLRVIEEAMEIDCVGPRVHISGGEAFLRYRDLVRMFLKAQEMGYADIGSTTNGFWARNPKVALEKCRRLRDAGVTYLEVSIDHWHLPHVELGRIKCLVDAARITGIRMVLRTLTTRSHGVDEIVEFLMDAETDLSGVLIANAKVQPVGRAATDVPADEIIYGHDDTSGSCDSALNLTVAPNGNVYPCCAGSEMTEALAFGNVRDESLADVVTAMRTDLLLRTLVHNGSGSLVPILEELGLGHLLLPKYSSICHLCWHMFQDETMSSALKERFAEVQFEELVAMVERLGARPEPALAAQVTRPKRNCSEASVRS